MRLGMQAVKELARLGRILHYMKNEYSSFIAEKTRNLIFFHVLNKIQLSVYSFQQ